MDIDRLLKLANKKLNNGNSSGARKVYEDILRKYPKNSRAIAGLKNIDRILTKSDANSETLPTPIIDQLVTLHGQKNFELLLQRSLKLRTQFPESILLYNFLGAAYYELGQFDDAINCYRIVLKSTPNNGEVFYNLGVIYEKRQELETSLAYYRNALSNSSYKPNIYVNIGNILRAKGNFSEAIQQYENALKLEPNNSSALYNIGLLMLDKRSFPKAIDYFKSAIRANPTFIDAWYNLAISFQEIENIFGAFHAYKKVIALNPSNADALNNLANLLLDLGHLSETIENYRRALCANIFLVAPLSNLNNLYVQLNDSRVHQLHANSSYSEGITNDLKIPIQSAIGAFIQGDIMVTRGHIDDYEKEKPTSFNNLVQKDKRFCTAFHTILSYLLEKQQNHHVDPPPNVFHVGESHCLSYAHQKLIFGTIDFIIRPMITFGAKAFHFSPKKSNAFSEITKKNLSSIPKCSKVIISFGEIDCRPDEGIITAALKLNRPEIEIIRPTIQNYLDWFFEQNIHNNHELYFFNVPAPVFDTTQPHDLNLKVAKVVALFNNSLTHALKERNFKLIDTYKSTVTIEGFSNKKFHFDQYHLGPNFIPIIQQQVECV
tara:strand:+ start:2219 stop:4030 length:1812 start_codon:yes stop_codon:yes gene_type:complete